MRVDKRRFAFCAAFAAGVSLAAVSDGEDLIQDAFSDYQAPYKLGRPILTQSPEKRRWDSGGL